MISVLILTKDEEINLPRCLDSVSWCDDIVVLDSGSTDRTVEIATRSGARVFFRDFDNENAQRTHSLGLPFRHSWVYNPDADEIATEELVSEMFRCVENAPKDAAVFRMRRKDMLLGRWIKRSSLYPTWLVRLYRPDRIRFDRQINLTISASGSQHMLSGHLIHYSFSKGISAWIDKHNRYSGFEALESLKSASNVPPGVLQAISLNPVVRRSALKEFSSRMPGRPLLRFVYMYCFRLGVLDGMPGLYYCTLVAFYELMIVIKMIENKRRSAGESL
jgi:glycosyltransferase involved in cell wall biosynthesis